MWEGKNFPTPVLNIPIRDERIFEGELYSDRLISGDCDIRFSDKNIYFIGALCQVLGRIEVFREGHLYFCDNIIQIETRSCCYLQHNSHFD